MDPLSVAASVAGLLTAAKAVSSAIDKIATTRKTGPKEIIAIKSTVDTLRSVLLQLQLLLFSRVSINHERASLILVDEVVVTLTACVMTFSGLDGCMKGLEADQELGILDSIRWASKEKELRVYLQHLEAHKTSLTLMMSILTCQSTHNAEQDAGELKILMVRVLESNESLAHRMSLMESSMAMSTFAHQEQDSASMVRQGTIQGLPETAPRLASSQDSGQYTLITHAFEEDLQRSWVYQRSSNRGARFSNASSVQLSLSWSMLSGLSLSNISNIAVQSLPIFEKDLQNSQIYNFGNVRSSPTEEDPTISSQNTPANNPKAFDMELWRQTHHRVNYGSQQTAARPMARYKTPLSAIFGDTMPQREADASSQRKPVATPELPTSEQETRQKVREILSKDKNDRLPLSAKKQVQKESISTPKLLFSDYKFGTVDNTAPLQLSKCTTGLKDENVRQYPDRRFDAEDNYKLSSPPSYSVTSPLVDSNNELPRPNDFEDVKEEIKSLLDEIRQPLGVDPEPDDDPL